MGLRPSWNWVLKRVLFWAILIYVMVCGLLYLFQRSLIYPASHQAFALPKDFVPWTLDGRLLGYKRVHGTTNCLFFLHGNGGNARGWAGAIEQFPGDVFIVEFPGYGERPGRPTEASLKAAALEAFDALPPYPRRVVCGQSIGTAITPALFLDRADRVDFLLLITPFTSLRDVATAVFPLFPARWLVKDPMLLYEAWKDFPGPTCVVLAGRDEVIPRKASAPFRSAVGANRKVVVLPEATHNTIQPDRRAWEEWTRLGPPYPNATTLAFSHTKRQSGLHAKRSADSTGGPAAAVPERPYR